MLSNFFFLYTTHFLTFESSTNGGGIRLSEQNNSLGKMCDRFIYMGYTGNGYPVYINESTSEVVYIDYDNENNVAQINSTIVTFAESLLVYVEFIKKIKANNGRRAYLEKNASKELLDWVSKSLLQIDAISLTQGGFWEEELSSFSE
ncbi:SUKH-4 family immunity protein [Metabacillus elymi]|nr:SUKH-4 family immunity protein [Metabacillus sp. KUDC1714]